MKRQALIDLFGTSQPSREMVAHKEEASLLARFRDRGESLYIVIYEDSKPYEIFYRGYSGD